MMTTIRNRLRKARRKVSQIMANGALVSAPVAVPERVDDADRHDAEPHQNARNHPGDEDCGDGDRAAGHRVDDHDVRRRDDESGRGGGCGDRHVEFTVVAFAVHLRNHKTRPTLDTAAVAEPEIDPNSMQVSVFT